MPFTLVEEDEGRKGRMEHDLDEMFTYYLSCFSLSLSLPCLLDEASSLSLAAFILTIVHRTAYIDDIGK